MSKDWTDKLGERLEKHETDAPEGLWQDIEAALDREAAAVPEVKSTKTVSMRRTLLAVAACIATIVVSGLLDYVGLDNSPSDVNVAVKTPDLQPSTHESGNAATETLTAEPSMTVHDELAYAQPHSTIQKMAEEKPLDYDAKSTELDNENHDVTETIPQVSEQETNYSEQGKDESEQDRRQRPSTGNVTYVRKNTQPMTRQKSSRKRKWSISAFTTNLPSTDFGGSGDMAAGEYNMMAADAAITNSTINNTTILQNSFPNSTKEYTYINGQSVGKMELDHKTPLNIGLKLRIGLTDRLFAETGIVYSYLKSEGLSAAQGYTQKLHYIGVPLGIGYELWRSGNVSVYVVGGGMAQKLVSGTAETQYYMRGYEEKETLREGGMQWSVNVSAGIEYNIKNIVRLYAEPGVPYYFDNGSRIDNIYKEKNTAMNLQFGLRFGM